MTQTTDPAPSPTPTETTSTDPDPSPTPTQSTDVPAGAVEVGLGVSVQPAGGWQQTSRNETKNYTELSNGKAILATLPEQQVVSIVASMGMPTPTEKSLGTVDELLADLEKIRERGYAVDDEEQEIGVRCFSMALPDAPTPTAISVSGPTTRVDWDFGERAVPRLREAAARLSAQLTRVD